MSFPFLSHNILNMKIVNSLNYVFDTTCVEHPQGESQTIPDDAIGLRELLQKHTRGQGIPTRTPVFLGEEILPDVTRMNKIEIIEAIRETEKLITEERARLQSFTEEVKLREIEEAKIIEEEEPEKKTTRKRTSKAADDDKKED